MTRPWTAAEHINAGGCIGQVLIAVLAWATMPPNETTLSKCVVALMLGSIFVLTVYWFATSRREAIREWEGSMK